MSSVISNDERRNYEIFRDCLATALVEKIAVPETKPRRRTKAKTRKNKKKISSPGAHDKLISDEDNQNKNAQEADLTDQHQPTALNTESTDNNDNNNVTPSPSPADQDDDLADFIDYLATETFTQLPSELKTCDYHDYTASPTLRTRYALPAPLTGADVTTSFPQLLDPATADSLTAYGITHEHKQELPEFLAPVLTAFLTTALHTAPPPPSTTRADVDGCEICGRAWINLSYHHLIPRFVHAKAVKRGWHRECDLQNVAWLCGACHRFVHRFKNHEELARRFYTVELLCAEEEVRRWAEWVGRLRWKGR